MTILNIILVLNFTLIAMIKIFFFNFIYYILSIYFDYYQNFDEESLKILTLKKRIEFAQSELNR